MLRLKLPAGRSYGIDLVPDMFPRLRPAAPNTALLQGCGISFLEYYPWTGQEFVYADPPYLLATRGGRKYYKAEMTDADHCRLIEIIKKIPANVMISGYASRLYDDALAGWERITFQSWTRAHTPRQEIIWMNYPKPVVLHDSRFVGVDFRDRWRIEKRRRNLLKKFLSMPDLERAALFTALVDVMAGKGPSADSGAAVHNARSGAPRAVAGAQPVPRATP